MRKYWGIILASVLLVCCIEDKEVAPQELAEAPLEQPVLNK